METRKRRASLAIAIALALFAADAATPVAQSGSAELPLSDPNAFVGRWVGTGYTCRGAEPEEVVQISYSVWSGLEARKIVGDDCVRSSELTWRNGKLNGNTIQVEYHVRPLGAGVWDDSWLAASLQVASRDELVSSFGVTYRRDPPTPPPAAGLGHPSYLGHAPSQIASPRFPPKQNRLGWATHSLGWATRPCYQSIHLNRAVLEQPDL